MTFMMSKARHLLVAITVVAALMAAATPAHATFPGKNGRIAFILGPDVYTMNSDGSDVRQLTNLGPDNSAAWESWSPDGKLIVFSEFPPPDFHGQLWLMNADGSNQHLLLAEPGITEVRPSFSPDGKTVVFSRGYDYNPDNGNPFIVDMYRVGVDGSGLTAITRHRTLGVHDYGPKYSPDGTTIVVGCDQRGGILSAVWVADPDGNNFRQLTKSEISARRPDWSPDGKTVAFQTHCCNPQNETIGVVNSDGTGLRELTHNGNDYFAGPHDFDPSWSPQGDAIVFEREAPDFSTGGIFVMKADGSGVRQALAFPASKFHPHRPSPIRNRITQYQRNGNRLQEIEEGGTLARWGPESN
jgi:Tol biopolymer transport system component